MKKFKILLLFLIFSSLSFFYPQDNTTDKIKNDNKKTDEKQNLNVIIPHFLNIEEYNFSQSNNSYIFVYKNYSGEDTINLENNTILNIDKFNFFSSSIEKIIDLLGKPSKVIILKENGFEHLNVYYGEIDFYFGIEEIKVKEIRFESSDLDYTYMNKLKIGSSIDEIINYLGKPKKIIKNKQNNWEDMVLYKDIDKKPGRGYISYNEKGVRFFILDNKISAIYLFKPK